MKVMNISDLIVESTTSQNEVAELKKLIETLERDNKMLLDKLAELQCDLTKREELALKDAETLCMKQIGILKDRAVVQELTLEECKKAEIYIKSLNVIKNAPKKIKSDVDNMPTTELLKMLNIDEGLKN